jgi:hypothetical protein
MGLPDYQRTELMSHWIRGFLAVAEDKSPRLRQNIPPLLSHLNTQNIFQA